MYQIRLIPALSLSGEDLVQTRKFGRRQYVGDPLNAVRVFNEKEVDEVAISDIDATKNGQRPNFSLLEKIVSECFMPVTYGGGVRDLATAKQLFELGIEKVAISALALEQPETFPAASEVFGAQSVVGVIDENEAGKWVDYRNGRMLGDTENVVASLAASGVGEIRVNNVARDGTLTGLNVCRYASLTRALDVPLVASGGLSSVDEIEAASKVGLSGIAAGAFCTLYGPHRAVLLYYPNRIEWS